MMRSASSVSAFLLSFLLILSSQHLWNWIRSWSNDRTVEPIMAVHAKARAPVYFLGVGGPRFIEITDHPAVTQLAAVGKEITTKVKPTAIVVFSAHWQDGPNTLKINVAESTDLIYDFSGFPRSYYEVKYPHKGSPEVAEKVVGKLSSAGIKVDKVERGLDHGVWVGFLAGMCLGVLDAFGRSASGGTRNLLANGVAAFNPKTNPLNCPIVQVSLYDNEDPHRHFRVGQALESLRDEGIVIIGAGMAVHNIAGFVQAMRTGRNQPYTTSFEKVLTKAVTAPVEDRQEQLADLLKRSDIRGPHPTFEHILPIYVSAGAAGTDRGEKLWDMPEGGLNWAQYRFGSVAAAT